MTEDKKFYMYGLDAFYTFTGEDSTDEKLNVDNSVLYMDNPLDYKYPISDNFLLRSYDNAGPISVRDTHRPLYDNSQVYINIPLYIDSLFSSYAFPYSFQSECIGLSSEAILIPYRRQMPGYLANNIPTLLLARIEDPEKNRRFVWSDTTFIDIEDSSIRSTQFISSLYTFSDYFFVNYASKCVRINSQGEVKIVETQFDKMFEYKNKIYGIGYEGFFSSDDLGENWNFISTTENSDARLMYNFQEVYDSLVGNYRDKLYLLNIHETGMNSSPLDVEGLETNIITSVSEFHNSSVIVTTRTGVFVKPKSDFFQLAEQ